MHIVQPAKIPSGCENKWISEVLQRQQKALSKVESHFERKLCFFSSGLNFLQKFNLNIFELDTFSTSKRETNEYFIYGSWSGVLRILFSDDITMTTLHVPNSNNFPLFTNQIVFHVDESLKARYTYKFQPLIQKV